MKRKSLVLIYALAVLWLAPAGGRAADKDFSMTGIATPAVPNGAPLSVDDLVVEALDRSPAVAAQKAKIAAAREMVDPAGALADPTIELNWTEDFMLKQAPSFDRASAEYRQELPFPGKTARRRDASSAEADAQAAELLAVERKLTADVRAAFAQLYAVDREREALRIAGELLKMIAAVAQTRYAAGQGNQEPPLKAQLAISRLNLRDAEAVAERATTAAELNRLLDRAGDQPLGEAAALPAGSRETAHLDEEALGRSPAVAARRAATATAARRMSAAQREVYPDFLAGVGAGAMQNVATGKQAPMGMLSFGVTLPVWQTSKQQPLIRAAGHDLEAARQAEREAVAAVRADAARLTAKLQMSAHHIALYRGAILPQTQAALNAGRAAYLTGQGDFTAVVDDFNMWLDARIDLARAEADEYAAWAALDALRPVEGAAP